MKKLFAVLMALTLVLSMGVLAFAVTEGSITIHNCIKDATYSVYQILEFTPSNEAADKGIYTIVPGWEAFFSRQIAQEYFTLTTIDDVTTVTLKDGVTEVDQRLAQDAIEYAKNSPMVSAIYSTAANSDSITFGLLPLGYYAIDTTVGTMCSLTNTNSKFEVVDKNENPDIDKFVKEDSTGNWGEVNDANIGQVVEYKSNITVGYGATNYIMHDKMSDGLTFNGVDRVTYKENAEATEETVVSPDNYSVDHNTETKLAKDNDTFDITFENDYILTLPKGSVLTVYYSAILNENAIIENTGNDNEVRLTYGDNNDLETSKHYTRTFTWKIDVLKFAKDGENEIALKDATFQLEDANGTTLKFLEMTGTAIPTYKVVKDGTVGAVDSITTNDSGKFEIIGLDEGEYDLIETNPPEGYNKLNAPVDVTIDSEYADMDTYTTTFSYTVAPSEDGFIKVENKTGTLLPETGGIGTTIFYVVGGVLMLAAFVVLVSKKRMASFA